MVFQSTHPSGVRQHVGVRLHGHLRISIHAPQWGATRATRNSRQSLLISIHAPQWGATPAISAKCAETQFQSTHPSGVRRVPASRFWGCDHISIHAPQWGATAGCRRVSLRAHNFNPRTPVGCDSIGVWSTRPDRYFNPRTPVGCDSLIHSSSTTSSYFNPRTPVGCDARRRSHQRARLISIHAPQWGATVRGGTPRNPDRFQSTHPSGVRPP